MIDHATSKGSFRSPLWISKGQVWEKPLSFQPGDDPIDWLEELNQAIVINEWDDRRALAIALALLPRAVRLSFLESNLVTFKDFEMAFRERYQDVGYKTRAFNEALNYRQADDEHVEVFIGNMLKLFDRANVTEETLKCNLLSTATNDSIRSEITKAMPATLVELIGITREAFSISQAIKEHEKNKLVNHTRSTVDDVVARMRKLSSSELDAVLSALGLPRLRQTGQRGQTQQAIKRNRTMIVCYRCEQPGHIARTCTAPLPVLATPIPNKTTALH